MILDVLFVKKYLKNIMNLMAENKDYLINLDSTVGDGDLGLTMSAGFAAAYDAIKLSEEKDLGKVFYQAGKTMANAVPSTMGTLMANGLIFVGKSLKSKTELSDEQLYTLFSSYFDGVTNLGKAKMGDKTFLDGLGPAIKVLKTKSSDPLPKRCREAYKASVEGFEQTATMVAVYGRAAIRGENSRSLKDPGAAVAVLLMKALLQTVEV